MDDSRFDLLTKALAAPDARRRVLGVLASLPLVGFAALLSDEEADASGRRKRHRRNNQRPPRRDPLSAAKKRKKKKRKKHKKGTKPCTPQSPAQTCDGQCGPVTNNCNQSVDCGACDCDATNCPNGCCQGGACHVDDDDACGTSGGICQSCAGTGATCGGGGTPGVCGCTPSDPCGAGVCGSVTNNCGEQVNCGGCSNPTPICANHTCAACSQHSDCGANALCLADGSCQACTVTCPGGTCAGTQLQEAIKNGGTIYVCPGRYTGRYNTFANVTLIGAGDGTNAANNTILDAQNTGRTVTNGASTTVLTRLRITGARETASFGGGIYHVNGTLTMTDCTVTGNANLGTGDGAGIYNQGGSVTMTRCRVTDNDGSGDGGGLFNIATLTMTNCQISDNDAGEHGGGIYVAAGTVTLDACTVSNNDANINGGGVIRASNNATVTLRNGTTITNNTPDNCFNSVPGCMG